MKTTTTMPPGTLIASGDSIATWHGTCAVCGDGIRPGERQAQLAIFREGALAHASCTSRIVTAGGPR